MRRVISRLRICEQRQVFEATRLTRNSAPPRRPPCWVGGCMCVSGLLIMPLPIEAGVSVCANCMQGASESVVSQVTSIQRDKDDAMRGATRHNTEITKWSSVCMCGGVRHVDTTKVYKLTNRVRCKSTNVNVRWNKVASWKCWMRLIGADCCGGCGLTVTVTFLY